MCATVNESGTTFHGINAAPGTARLAPGRYEVAISHTLQGRAMSVTLYVATFGAATALNNADESKVTALTATPNAEPDFHLLVIC